MSKYIDAYKITPIMAEDVADVFSRKEHLDNISYGYCMEIAEVFRKYAERAKQEQAKGIDGVVHHAACAHWIVTDQKKLATVLKEFPEGTEVELFIFAIKEEYVCITLTTGISIIVGNAVTSGLCRGVSFIKITCHQKTIIRVM